jgi:hypothetical protein
VAVLAGAPLESGAAASDAAADTCVLHQKSDQAVRRACLSHRLFGVSCHPFPPFSDSCRTPQHPSTIQDDAERMITASVCGGEQGCVMNSMEGLAHSEVAGTGSTGSTSSSNGSGTGSSSWYGSGGEQRPFSGGWEGSSWDGDLEFSSGGSGGVGGSGGGGGGAPWSSEGELELQQQQLQGSWSDAEAEQQGQQQSAAAVQQRRQRSGTAELALDLDSWQHVGYPIAVLAAVVACKNGVKRSHLIDAASDG